MEMYCIEIINYDDGDKNLIVGYATTEEKSKKMIDVMKETDGFESYDYEYYKVYVDMLIINDKKIEF